ncbi:ABC transporter substrate-binding protein [Halomonas sp. CUBES01]|uniref:ABC transporter substrate-binding protein n=1 Tax=Halomonas sp. CUBES01 TaxID=2897340 RepID=UPI001E33EC62|nr:ABC transporter substrate-binding protein [Halomonas sp. CUBES01]MEC4768129.1 ABC transporter substrate-binding protein [Halomonas sp. CUBES01]
MLKQALLMLILSVFSIFAESAERFSIVTSDWAAAETLSMLGVTPIAIAQFRNYQGWTGNEIIREESGIDIGLKPMPNLELISNYEPDFLLGDNPILLQHVSKLAPTIDTSLYPFEHSPWESVVDFTCEIAEQLDLLPEAGIVTAQANKQLAILRDQIKNKETPVVIAQFRDDRHAWVYGENNILHGVINQLGLTNAWEPSASATGLSVVTIDVLARLDGHLFIIESPAYKEWIRERLESSDIWQILISQREGEISYIPGNFWVFGAIPSALRFAESLVEALNEDAVP